DRPDRRGPSRGEREEMTTGLFGSSKAQRAAAAKEGARRADEAERQAREYAAEAAKHPKQRRGSSDPAADRYMIRQAEANQRIAAADARSFRRTAANALKWG